MGQTSWLSHPLTALLGAALAASLCATFRNGQGFAMLLALGVVLVIGGIWPWLSVRGARARVHAPRERAREGDELELELEIENRSPWPLWGLTIAGGFEPASLATESGCTALATLPTAPRRSRTTITRAFTPDCRGEYPLTPPRLACGFPWGLWTASRPADVDGKVLVWPRVFPVRPIPTAAGARRLEDSTAALTVGTSGDTCGVRPWREGDSIRRVHWAQTARHDRLIVREQQQPSLPCVQIVVDLDPAMHAGVGSTSSQEWAIRVAASLCDGWLAAGAQLEAVWETRPIPRGAGAAQRRKLLDGLARVGAESISLRQLLDRPECRRFDGGLQVVIATERSLGQLPAAELRDRRRLWVLLNSAGFEGTNETAAPSLPLRPWMWLPDAESIPDLLATYAEEPLGVT